MQALLLDLHVAHVLRVRIGIAQGLAGFRVSGLELRIWGLELRVQDSGLRV